MRSWFRLDYWFWFGVLSLGALPGCVDRRIIIASDPHGAVVYDEKNHPIGTTPVDHPFTYYGTYRFRLVAPGYETLVIEEKIRAPWYEWFGLDFISENLLPCTIRDRRYIRPTLQPLKVIPPEVVLQQGQGLRDYGHTVGVLLPTASVVNPQVAAPPSTATPPIVPPPPGAAAPPPPPPVGGSPPSTPPINVAPVPPAPIPGM